MALLRQGNVKFTDNQTNLAENADGLMTLVHVRDPAKLPVYFCATPFLLDNLTVREIVANAATRCPQSVSVFIDTPAHKHQPDLMLSIQAYCVHNDDVIKLDSIEFVPESVVPEITEITLIIGSDALLQQCLEETSPTGDTTIIYFPTNIQDQLKLHDLLEIDSGHSVIPVISSGVQSFTGDQPHGTGLMCTIDLAIAQDAELFRWIEGNASQLAVQQTEALSQLLMRYCTSASTNAPAFLTDDTIALSRLAELSDNSLNPGSLEAILLLIKTQVAVEAGLLPDGANARVWQLLSTLGHTLYFDALAEHASREASQLFGQAPRVLLNSIGELSPAQTLEAKHVEAAMLWLEEQNKLHNR